MRPKERRRWTDLAKFSGESGREDCQGGWQAWVGQHFSNISILDVGAGLGLSKSRLANNRNTVFLQDLAPGLTVDYAEDISQIHANSFDVVTAFDVIEHIQEDEAFLAHLYRIARQSVVLTTPNCNRSHCKNHFHRREYTPEEWVAFLSPYKVVNYLSSDHPYLEIDVLDREAFLKHTKRGQGAIVDVASG